VTSDEKRDAKQKSSGHKSTLPTGRGNHGASHQTGWTGLIARLLDTFGRTDAKDLELRLGQVSARLVREQVGGEKTRGD